MRSANGTEVIIICFGTIDFLISRPLQALGHEAIAAMIRAFEGGPEFPPQSISLPFELYTPENL